MVKKVDSELKQKREIPKDIEEYIKDFPEEVQSILQYIRKTIKEMAPGAEEKISYGMPTFTLNGKNLVHFAAYKKHIGFYPTPSGIVKFKDKISAYEWSKGAVQFPLDMPVPFDLIREIVAFRVKENLGEAKSKK